MINRDLYIHTNVPAPYRKHMFELLAPEFRKTVVLFNEDYVAYKFWKTGLPDWNVDCRADWHYWPRKSRLAIGTEFLKTLLTQRWGSIHLVSGLRTIPNFIVLTLSALIGHSILIGWNDAGFASDIIRSKWRLKRWFDGLFVRLARKVFTPGALGIQYSCALGYPQEKVINAYFSHDIELFVSYRRANHREARARIRAEFGIPCDKIVLLNVSRLLHWKRLIDFAKALEIIDQNYPEVAKACEVILIGDGDDHSHEKVLGGLRHIKVHTVKQVPPEDVMAYYCASDLFVFPSEGDIWGLVVNEALSMGVPVICTERIGAASVVKDGKNGYLVPARRPEIIAERINQLICTPKLLSQFKESAREIESYWRTELGVKALVDFCRTL